jgi:hypothetical protein
VNALHIKGIHILLLLILLWAVSVYAQGEKVVEAEGWVSLGEDTTPAVARATALNNARRNALETALGVSIHGSSVVYNSELVSDLVHTATKGSIVKEEVLENRCETRDQQILCLVKIRAHVRSLDVDRRGNFKISRAYIRRHESNIRSHNPVFHHNDEIQVRLTVNHESYVTIFSIDQYGTVTKLFPNAYAQQNRVHPGEEFVFPDDAQRQMGLTLRVTAPGKLTRAIESVLIIAARQNIDILTNTSVDNPTISDVMRELSLIEPSVWVEKTIGYEVRR